MVTEILILGLDGATFDIIRPLCDEGKLPVLDELIDNGVYGNLESTFPPVTGPAWTSLASGKNPGKTGICDFINFVDEDRIATRVLSSKDMKQAGAYWDLLSRSGIKVGVANYPFLYPPYEINGVMVSGVGTSPANDITYPINFKQELLDVCGDYKIDVPWRDEKYAHDVSRFLDDIFDLLKINENSLDLLLDKDFQVLTYVISACDFAQHYMWRYIDPSHPYYHEGNEYKAQFVKIWQEIDRIIGIVIEKLSSTSNIIIVSDHGFGPHRCRFYTNTFLEQAGYLQMNQIATVSRNLQEKAYRIIRGILPSLAEKIANSPKVQKMVVESESQIDMHQSLAFSPVNASVNGRICINRYADAFISGSLSLETVKDEIVGKLQETCSDLGLRIRTFYREELYNGPCVELAPDILFEIDDGECSVWHNASEEVLLVAPDDPVYNGIHKMNGIFIAYGPAFKQGIQIQNAKIYDIAPTLLHMCGIPIPDDVDGKILQGIFNGDYFPPDYQSEHQVVQSGSGTLRKRIKSLKGSGKLNRVED